jgi:hypothetical protein
MATKSKSAVSVERLPVPPPAPEPKSIRLTIDLTLTEAEDIRRLCMNIGGDPKETRGVFDQIDAALDHAGVNTPLRGIRIQQERQRPCPGLTFTSYDKRAGLGEFRE